MTRRLWLPTLAIAAFLGVVTWFAPNVDKPSVPPHDLQSNVSDAVPRQESMVPPARQLPLTTAPSSRGPAPEAHGADDAEGPQVRYSQAGHRITTWVNEAGETVVNIGEFMDPDDPSTWPPSDSEEPVNVGVYMNPDDPSTWPVEENATVVNVGVYVDPDDPTTWPASASSAVVNVGQFQDPDAPETWVTEDDGRVVNIGEDQDPDAPYR